MKKKSIIMLAGAIAAALALIILLTVVLVHHFKVNQGPVTDKSVETVIAAEDIQAQAGKTVKIPLTISGNPGFMGALLQLEYDTDVLEYINVEKGGIFSDCDAYDAGGK